MFRRLPLVAVLCVCAGIQTSTQRDSTSPKYVPLEATIEPLARPANGGNTVLRVRFDPRWAPPTRVPYQTEAGAVVLADDGLGFDAKAGDGLYTALGAMNLAAFRDRLLRLSQSKSAMPTRTYRFRSKQPVDARLDPSQWLPGRQFRWEPWGDPTGIDKARSLLVRATSVVEDPTRTRASCDGSSMGVWSFGYLMEQMANTPVTGVTGAQFTREWLDTWMGAQVVNGWTVNARTQMQAEILDPWIAASGGPGQPLDLAIAPFKLLAIVNRLDLRQQAAYGGSGGELRFVFGLTTGENCNNFPGTFQVILEFGLPFTGCLNQQAWAQQWKDLASLPLGSPAYNAALEAITQQVVVANAGGGKPNGSALNQIRTNENRLDDTGDGLDWQAKEYRIDPITHKLKLSTLAQTPHRSVSKPVQLDPWVNGNEPAILANNYTVPLKYPGVMSFRAGSVTYGYVSHWSSPGIVNNELRHQFSVNTCNGCHTTETDTEFRHIGMAAFGSPAPMSGFLTGTWANDPVGPEVRWFDDLERRAVDMDALIQTSCFLVPLDLPLVASH